MSLAIEISVTAPNRLNRSKIAASVTLECKPFKYIRLSKVSLQVRQ